MPLGALEEGELNPKTYFFKIRFLKNITKFLGRRRRVCPPTPFFILVLIKIFGGGGIVISDS